jgi:hypothetical protein
MVIAPMPGLVAKARVDALHSVVPVEVAGIAFLSGGQPAQAELWRLAVEEWLSGCPTNLRATFSQVNDVRYFHRAFPVKPSAQPTQVRTLDLPPKSPGQSR